MPVGSEFRAQDVKPTLVYNHRRMNVQSWKTSEPESESEVRMPKTVREFERCVKQCES